MIKYVVLSIDPINLYIHKPRPRVIDYQKESCENNTLNFDSLLNAFASVSCTLKPINDNLTHRL